MVLAVTRISSGEFFDNLVGAEVDCVGRSYTTKRQLLLLSLSCRLAIKLFSGWCVPAPTTTLLIPRHNVRMPSRRDMVERALDMPV